MQDRFTKHNSDISQPISLKLTPFFTRLNASQNNSEHKIENIKGFHPKSDEVQQRNHSTHHVKVVEVLNEISFRNN